MEIKEKLKTLPKKPGVYLHKDKNGTVINVTKEDFKLVLTYLDSDIKSVDITDFEINNGKISFKLSQSFTSSNLTIVFSSQLLAL